MSSPEALQRKIDKANITDDVKESLRLIEDLKFFLATAPANWQANQVIRRYYLNPGEGYVSCIFWNNLYFITGTDIVRCIVYKFQHFGRKIIDRKKFEEGVFSDLRNLKCGTDAILEPPKSPFLNFLYRNACLRTQKKQKVFFWFNVPHDKLMADALERDLKKEKSNQTPTTIADREPALSFEYEDEKLLYTYLVEQNYNKRLTDSDSTDENVDTTTSSNNSNDNNDDANVSTSTSKDPKLLTSKASKHKLDNDSPEYLSTNVNTNSLAGFEFLNKETPDEYKNPHSDDEDDFPLDYFEEGPSNDYIVVDPNFQNYPNPNLYDENYDFIANQNYSQYAPHPMATNQVAANDEYLIEQTLPIKTPLTIPRSAKLNPGSANTEDHFHLPPVSAKYPYNFFRFQEPPSAKSLGQLKSLENLQQNEPQSAKSLLQPQFIQSSQGYPQPQTIQVPPPTAGPLASAPYAQDPYFFSHESEYWPSFPDQIMANQGLVGAGGYMFSEMNDPVNYYPPPSAVHPYGPLGGFSGPPGSGIGVIPPPPGSATGPGFFPPPSGGPPPLSATASSFNQKQFGQHPHGFPGPPGHHPHPHFPPPPSFVGSPNFAGPSARQQSISANMMKKKLQLKKQGAPINSPEQSSSSSVSASNPLGVKTSKNSVSKPGKESRSGKKSTIS